MDATIQGYLYAAVNTDSSRSRVSFSVLPYPLKSRDSHAFPTFRAMLIDLHRDRRHTLKCASTLTSYADNLQRKSGKVVAVTTFLKLDGPSADHTFGR